MHRRPRRLRSSVGTPTPYHSDPPAYDLINADPPGEPLIGGTLRADTAAIAGRSPARSDGDAATGHLPSATPNLSFHAQTGRR